MFGLRLRSPHILNYKILLFFLLFIVAAIFSAPNIGGIGLTLPFNAVVWMVATWVICLGIFLVLDRESIRYPRMIGWILLFPLIAIISGLMVEVGQPIDWFFRQAYIVGGFLFLLSLFQLQFNSREIESVLFVLVVAVFVQAGIGILQLMGETFGYFPPSPDAPRGIFQQINIQVSFVVTGFIALIYLISSNCFRSPSLLLRIFAVFFSGICSFIVIYSGSRVGILSFLLATPLIILSRKRLLVRRKIFLVFIGGALIVGGGIGKEGFDNLLIKSNGLLEYSVQQEYRSNRISMYAVGWSLIKEKPFFGHGVGNFTKVWAEESGKFLAENPHVQFPASRVTHPHNEIMFWAIEGGLLSVLGIIIVFICVMIQLKNIGWERGGGYAAMLLPITLHTQVEMPFYGSSLHWFVWLFLIYLCMRHGVKVSAFSISGKLLSSMKISVLIGGVVTSYFFVHSVKASAELFLISKAAPVKPVDITNAWGNLYFRPIVEQVVMRKLLYNSIQNNNPGGVKEYLRWGESFVVNNPDLIYYEELVKGYSYIGLQSEKCKMAAKGLAFYPRSLKLAETIRRCELATL